MIAPLVQLAGGLLVLTKAADWLARAVAGAAELTGFSRALLGAVVVGLMTNLPEFAVSSAAALGRHPEIAFGNAVGSNVVNTGLVLGVLLIRSGRAGIDASGLRVHGLPMIASAALLYALAMWQDVTRPVAALLLLACGAYVAWSLGFTGRPAPAGERTGERPGSHGGEPGGEPVEHAHRGGWPAVAALAAVSLPLVFLGSRWVLGGAVDLARRLEISEAVVALALIALGTSLPELATALAAAGRGHQDTSVGIIAGSNVYNALGVLGLAGLISPLPVTLANRLFDLPVMLVALALPLLPLVRGKEPGRRTGYALVALYGVYTYSLFTLYGIFS